MTDTAHASFAVILVVDDDEPIRETLTVLLEDLGYTALVAANGEEALLLFHTAAPHLILTDLMMPRLTGAQLIERIRRDPQYHEHPIPLVLMSAAGERALSSVHADAIVQKPFALQALEALLFRLLSPPEA